jgi:hypothetical protein
MTARIDPWLQCDDDSCLAQYPEDAGDITWTDRTIRELRAGAKDEGWRFTRDGRDFCPDHASQCSSSGYARRSSR